MHQLCSVRLYITNKQFMRNADMRWKKKVTIHIFLMNTATTILFFNMMENHVNKAPFRKHHILFKQWTVEMILSVTVSAPPQQIQPPPQLPPPVSLSIALDATLLFLFLYFHPFPIQHFLYSPLFSTQFRVASSSPQSLFSSPHIPVLVPFPLHNHSFTFISSFLQLFVHSVHVPVISFLLPLSSPPFPYFTSFVSLLQPLCLSLSPFLLIASTLAPLKCPVTPYFTFLSAIPVPLSISSHPLLIDRACVPLKYSPHTTSSFPFPPQHFQFSLYPWLHSNTCHASVCPALRHFLLFLFHHLLLDHLFLYNNSQRSSYQHLLQCYLD